VSPSGHKTVLGWSAHMAAALLAHMHAVLGQMCWRRKGNTVPLCQGIDRVPAGSKTLCLAHNEDRSTYCCLVPVLPAGNLTAGVCGWWGYVRLYSASRAWLCSV
jgi:hypothetical protein